MYRNQNFHTQVHPSPSAGNEPDFLVDLTFLASGQRMLASTDSGIVYADNTVMAHAQTVLGFTLQAGQSMVPMLSEGYYVDPTMAWVPELPLWLSTSGFLTQTRPTAGFLMQVGRVIEPTRILIQIQPAVILA